MSGTKKNPMLFILIFYLVCVLFRAVEYLVLRTDQSIIGEAFIHKLIGIALLAWAVRHVKYSWSDIGFNTGTAVKNICLGFLFGLAVYAVAYASEMLMLSSPSAALRFYASSYSATGDAVVQSGAIFVLVCVIGNVINVIMEEGIFRGLFIRLMEDNYSFLRACLFSALLFGVWHIAQPVRNVLDGVQSPGGAAVMGLMLVLTSALGGIQYVLLVKMTGSLWFAMSSHFVNNAIVNLLHVVTTTGTDEMQTVRIAIAQTLSFVAVFVAFLLKHRKRVKK